MNIWETGLSTHLFEYLRNPADLRAVQEIYRGYTMDKTIQASVSKTLLADSQFKELYDKWYIPAEYSLEQLSELPASTFGHQYAAFMQQNNLKLDFIDPFEGKDVLSYLWCRAKHVHDITHFLLGFDTSMKGEAGVKGFELAQYRSPAGAALLGAGLLAVSASAPEAIAGLMGALMTGYAAGLKSPFFNAIKWDLEWNTPMAELRIKFALPPAI